MERLIHIKADWWQKVIVKNQVLIMTTFSPVVMIKSIRILLSIVAYYDYEIWKMDVKIAFLNGYLEENIYMLQPNGFITEGQ